MGKNKKKSFFDKEIVEKKLTEFDENILQLEKMKKALRARLPNRSDRDV